MPLVGYLKIEQTYIETIQKSGLQFSLMVSMSFRYNYNYHLCYNISLNGSRQGTSRFPGLPWM